jgi:phosphatidylserine/phosphatidylglycerophosphate/cardiolipin synthase-like enzyme
MRAFLFGLPIVFACNAATLKYPPDAGTDDVAQEDSGLPFPSTSNIKVIVEPSDDGNGILNAIQNAKTSVHMTMYYLSSNSILNALIARKKAGVDVKVILNQTFPDPMMDNTPELNQLSAAGIPVQWAPKAFTYTHAKCVIIDGAEAWIMTMNLTFTSPSQNREFLAVDSDPADVAEAESIFAADFSGVQAMPSGRLVLSPSNSRERLTALMNLATQTLDIESETISDTKMVAALQAIKAKGVAVRIVVSDQMGSPAMSQAVSALKQAGIPIVKLGSPYVHAKAMVVDGAAAFVGSENLTQNSLDSNREIGVIMTGPAVGTVAQTIDADFKAGTPL